MGGVSPLLGLEPVLFTERVHRLTVYTLFEGTSANVVEGYSVELEDYPRISMEYLPGQTVTNTFFRGNFDAFDVSDVTSVVSQLADALSYVHRKGYLHLDVKTSNVMYNDGEATLLDFSVAEPFSSARPLKDNAGTTEYMAPEQTHRDEVGFATDVFGLGVVFYRLLTGGKLPYRVVKRLLPGDDEDNEPRRQLDYEVQPTPPSQIDPRVSRSLEAVVMKAIQPSIDDRYQSPADMRAALLRAQ